MTGINPLHSISGFAHEHLDSLTHVDSSEGALNKAKIAGGLISHAALIIASAIETAVRYVLAYGSLAISFALGKEQKQSFKDNYVTPFFKHAELNKSVFTAVKKCLTIRYNDHVEPFLREKVQTPS